MHGTCWSCRLKCCQIPLGGHPCFVRISIRYLCRLLTETSAILTSGFCCLPQSLQTNSGVICALGYDVFQIPSQFATHQSSYQSSLVNWYTDNTKKTVNRIVFVFLEWKLGCFGPYASKQSHLSINRNCMRNLRDALEAIYSDQNTVSKTGGEFLKKN